MYSTLYVNWSSINHTTLYTIIDTDNINCSLSTTDFEKDLGVWISFTSHPSIQCQKSYSEAMQHFATVIQILKYILLNNPLIFTKHT